MVPQQMLLFWTNCKIDTGHEQKPLIILNKLVLSPEFDKTHHHVVGHVCSLLHNGHFKEDFGENVEFASELTERTVQQAFIHIGCSKEQKSLAT